MEDVPMFPLDPHKSTPNLHEYVSGWWYTYPSEKY